MKFEFFAGIVKEECHLETVQTPDTTILDSLDSLPIKFVCFHSD